MRDRERPDAAVLLRLTVGPFAAIAAIAVGQKLPVQRLLPARKSTLRVTPESGRKTVVREETLDGKQPALGFAIDSVRLVTGAQRVVPLA